MKLAEEKKIEKTKEYPKIAENLSETSGKILYLMMANPEFAETGK